MSPLTLLTPAVAVTAVTAIAVPTRSVASLRTFATTTPKKAKIMAILYKGGKAAEEEPRLLGTVENKLGLSDWLKQQGHEFIVTDDKEGPGSVFQKEIHDTDILITTPFHPGYLTADLFKKAKKLKLCVTAGVGSDHIDLNAANEHNVTVAEVTDSNTSSVAEHVVMSILLLIRNYTPAHEQIVGGEWDVAPVARLSFDLEDKVVGTIGAGRIGRKVLKRLQPFGCKELLYFDYAEMSKADSEALSVRRVEKIEDMVAQCDVVTINCPLHEQTLGLFNEELLSKMKKGAYLVNTARGAICVAEDVQKALESGQLSGYAGDVWNIQPAPKDHPWRSMRNPLGGGNGMVPHISGTSLDAQLRYASGTRDIIKRHLEGSLQEPANLIVENGEYATKAYGSRKN
ncbi:formate dehydrogenase (NAD+) [Saitozyma podzolica]|uniref:Formate dehydrogenase n=1 Tax=Saitozyma podzolica TaxID=1890683 RepID=A0A427XPR5_9TREE|nr:formate dehydrogenase (NAD+) [Saitozyma podzolica]